MDEIGMGGPLSALVVGEDRDRVRRWSAWLEQGGFVTFVCPGPRLTWNCPRLDGEPCPRREMADVAVVAVHQDATGEERLCTTVPDDGTTVLLRDEDVSVVVRDKGVELLHPAPALLIEAARRALGRSERPGGPP